MILESTSASSGLTTRSRSASVFEGGDLQQGDQLAASREPVLHDGVVAELEELFDPDAAVAQDLDDRPDPEGVLFFDRQVAQPAGDGGVVDPYAVSPGAPYQR